VQKARIDALKANGKYYQSKIDLGMNHTLGLSKFRKLSLQIKGGLSTMKRNLRNSLNNNSNPPVAPGTAAERARAQSVVVQSAVAAPPVIAADQQEPNHPLLLSEHNEAAAAVHSTSPTAKDLRRG